MKRTAIVALWVLSFWYFGSVIALFLGVSDLLGPILGLAAGSLVALVAVDPRKVISSRRITLGG